MRIRASASTGRIAGSSLYRSVYRVGDASVPARLAGRATVDVPGGRVRVAGLLALPVAVALLAVWLIADPRTPDLAAQVYRVGLFGHVGFAVWDDHWYAGHHLPGYSLLFPALGSLLGLRLVAVLCVLVSTVLFERIALTAYGPSARWGAAAFAVVAVGDVWVGRVAFAMGVSLGLAAVLALLRGRAVWAGVLAALCAAASPVAGVLLALAGLTHALHRRSPRTALVLGAPACAVVLALALLFPKAAPSPIQCCHSPPPRSSCSLSCGRCRRASGCWGSGRSCICWPAFCA